MKSISFAATLLLIAFCSAAQNVVKPVHTQENWSKDYEPFRIVGNLYYVGTYDLACYLITTPKGHILINTGLVESVPMIRTHVEKLGFRFADIKCLLITHAHYDHCAGIAEIKKMTGGSLMVNEYDAPVMADGGNSDFLFGGKGSSFEPAKTDRLLRDRDTIRVGDMKVTSLHHPGHTKGASSFLFDVQDQNRSYRILIANMPTILEETKPGMATYPNVASEYAGTLDKMKKLQFDIWLASHASQFDLHTKRKAGDRYHPDVFIDRKGYDAGMEDLQKAYVKRFGNK